MARSKSIKSELREWMAAEHPPRITGEIWRSLLARFAPVSESYLRDLLLKEGASIDQPWSGVRQHTLEELETSLRELCEVYSQASQSGDRDLARYCRKVVIAAKDRAKFAAAKGNRAKEEMIEWMMVWLESPEVFPAWVEARKRRLTSGKSS
jgi:hypothetical protein